MTLSWNLPPGCTHADIDRAAGVDDDDAMSVTCADGEHEYCPRDPRECLCCCHEEAIEEMEYERREAMADLGTALHDAAECYFIDACISRMRCMPNLGTAFHLVAHEMFKANREAWARLPLRGYWDDRVERLELRNCPCGSTLAIVIP